MIIREAKLSDAASIARIDVDTWRTTYKDIVPQSYNDSLSYEQRTEVWQGRIRTLIRRFCYVAEDDDGNVIGFAGGGPETSGKFSFAGELDYIYVSNAHQRQGTGRRLAATVALKLKQQGYTGMIVWVFKANRYKAFYEALGGRPVAQREVDKYGPKISEIAYAWEDLNIFGNMLKPDYK